MALLGALGVGSLVGVFWWYGRGVEAIDAKALRDYRPPQVTRIVDRNGTLIGELFRERRTFAPYESIPSHVENAFLAAEDAEFHRHEGMDLVGMVRALLVNVRSGSVKQGASTITQQVVKVFLLSPERTLERKVQELVLARRLERRLEKREILELYLNEIYFGHGRYGVEEASRFYFGKGVADINLGQAAILAGLPKAPGRDSPIKNPEAAKNRQVYVLGQMVKHGFATARDAQRYIDAPMELADPKTQAAKTAAARVQPGAEEFVDHARAVLAERYGEDKLETLGATVTMTVDLALQRAARKSVMEGLQAVDRRQRFGHGIKPAKEANLARARKKGKGGPLKVGQVLPVIIESGEGKGLPEEGFAGRIGETPVFVSVPVGSRYDEPDASHPEQFPVGGITMARIVAPPASQAKAGVPAGWARAEIGSGPQSALVLTDVKTGEVLAMVGGDQYERGGFNRVMRAKRQPGSAFKPFVYGAALASRKFTAATLVSDSPEIYEKWRPTNFERDVYRGDIRVREALIHSVNTVAIKLLDAVGFEAVHAFAAAAGIDSPLAKNLSLALGTSEIPPFELMEGYLTLARGGQHIEPQLVVRIEVPGEKPWTPPAPEPPVRDQEGGEAGLIGEDVAFLITSLMGSVVAEGTGKRALALERPAAGKTGTSADNKDAWFAGFTRSHVAVAWVGFDRPRRIGKSETGGRAALPIWLGAMKAAVAGQPAEGFVPPQSVGVRTIDRASGLLAPSGVEVPPESVLEEYFLAGTEPVEEAVPDAVPETDLLLDLYAGGDPTGSPDGGLPGGAPPVPTPGPDTGPDTGSNGPPAGGAAPSPEPDAQSDRGGSPGEETLPPLPSVQDTPAPDPAP